VPQQKNLSVFRLQNYFGISFDFEFRRRSEPSPGAAGFGLHRNRVHHAARNLAAASFAIYESPRLVGRSTAASTAVARDMKFADPVAPNRLPEAPLPKAAPMSAPFPCCNQHQTDNRDAGNDVHRHQYGMQQSMSNLVELNSGGGAYGEEIRRHQRCAANQTAVDIRLAKKFAALLALTLPP
jgi:hypothetical protein